MQPQIRIAIIEDIIETGDALQEAINDEEDLECTQVYRNAEDALVFLPKNPPDIVVTDIGLPVMSGIEAMKRLIPQVQRTQFCMYTIYEDDEHVFDALKEGAKGYILKEGEVDDTLNALRELYGGGSPMSPVIARRVIDVFQTGGRMPQQKDLPITDRETELLEYLANGLLYKEIAEKMSITIGTVKQHIHKIYGKLQVANRTEAVNKLRGRY